MGALCEIASKARVQEWVFDREHALACRALLHTKDSEVSKKAASKLLLRWRRSRDLSNGYGPPTIEPDAKPCGANVRSSVSFAQTRHSPSGQFRKFKLTHYRTNAVGDRVYSAQLHPLDDELARLGRLVSNRPYLLLVLRS
jgi:hypothetical protein